MRVAGSGLSASANLPSPAEAGFAKAGAMAGESADLPLPKRSLGFAQAGALAKVGSGPNPGGKKFPKEGPPESGPG